jgi:hypothetical protein
MFIGGLRELRKRPIQEGFPVAVLMDAPQLQQGLGTLSDPSHPSVVEADGDEVIHCALDGSRADLEIAIGEPLLVHHPETLGQVSDGGLESFASPLVSRPRARDAPQRRA